MMTPAELDRLADLVADRVAIRLAETPRYLSKQQFADTSGLSIATVERRIADGTIEVIRIGRRVVIDPNKAFKKTKSKGSKLP